ncbi:hypothetical protein ASC95_18470 [Pelomonas sp. Root1217]|uniref:hypothetical protein n=1 Tax=Pelomonas sp. Root1217 TaxID=1736430 RepID=UPI0007103D88|nr:hypothetical protein [Pelomonas sp. Root1217]KQV47969.1 hypothetical protein ASC95_18470 [Pelomonas sp. Root1217]
MNPNSISHRALSEPCSFALLQWPALIGLLAIDQPGLPWLALRVLLGLWLAAMLIASYAGGRGAGFGNAMLLQCGLVVAAWWMHPSAWAYAWLAAIPLLLLAAQRLRLRRMALTA